MGSYHILLVDDDLITSSALKAYLEMQHYTVSLAEDCQHARDMLRSRQKVDLMILDYLMPDGSGTELLKTISQENDLQRPPVLMSSSIVNAHNPGWEKLFQRLPPVAQSMVHGFVNKPYSFDHIDHTVKKMLKIRVNHSDTPELLSGDYIAPTKPPSDRDAA